MSYFISLCMVAHDGFIEVIKGEFTGG